MIQESCKKESEKAAKNRGPFLTPVYCSVILRHILIYNGILTTMRFYEYSLKITIFANLYGLISRLTRKHF